MSILQAMYAGSSALNSFSEAITVIGNNLANANTTAFKASTTSFQDVLIQTVGSNGAGASTQVGTGVGLAGVQQDVTQGSFATSSNVTDLSIDGRGFFKLRTPVLGDEANLSTGARDMFYSRAGNFIRNKEGLIVNPNGAILQGKNISSDSNPGSITDGDIRFDDTVDNYAPEATTSVALSVNLDALGAIPVRDYNPEDASSYNYSTTVRVFDPLGVGRNVDVQFRKIAMNSPATVTGGNGDSDTAKGAGSIKTDATGDIVDSGGVTQEEIKVGIGEDVQVNFIFTPISANGTQGPPVFANPVYTNEDTHRIDIDKPNETVVSLSDIKVGDSLLADTLDPSTTYGVSYTTTKQQISFNLKEAVTDLELTFTPMNGGETIVSNPLELAKGHHTLDLRAMKDITDSGTGERINFANGKRYSISYEPQNVLTMLSGDDKRNETTGGVDNDNSWEWHAVVANDNLIESMRGKNKNFTAVDLPDADLSLNNVSSSPEGAAYTAGRLVFDGRGSLLEEGSTPITFWFDGAASPQEILFDFGNAKGVGLDSTNDFTLVSDTGDAGLTELELTDVKTGLYSNLFYADQGVLNVEESEQGGGSSQVAGGFSTTGVQPNGFPGGVLDKLSVHSDGIIRGSYTNGQTKSLFQIVLVDFKDEAALEQKGSSLFAETLASGTPIQNNPQDGHMGSIVSYSLEQSNVDMSGEFVRMITTQRGFQANSRIVTVVDGMLEELMALKR